MANPICLSPLKFYENENWMTHKMSYAYGHISPMVQPYNTIPPFQFVLPSDIIDIDKIYFHSIFKAADDYITIDATSEMLAADLSIIEAEGYKVLYFKGEDSPDIGLTEGQYFIEVILNTSDNLHQQKHFYSEVISYTRNMDDYIEIRYRNDTGNFHVKNGIVIFPGRFIFILFFKTELGKPEYVFEEEVTNRFGYNFIESQVSKKIYKFNIVTTEYMCDAMRLIRLCDNKKLFYKGQEFEMLSFNMDVDWQTQGDLASVNCEFETDNIIVNLGGFIPNTQ